MLRLLSEAGGRVRRRGPIWLAHLSRDLAREFGVDPKFRFTFQPEKATDGVELLAVGTRTLDHMIDFAQRRGATCRLIFVGSWVNHMMWQTAGVDPWRDCGNPNEGSSITDETEISTPALQRMRMKLSSICFANARARLVERRILYQRQALFRFRVAFCSDEKREVLFTLLIDPATEQTDTMVDIGRAVAMPAVWRGKKGKPSSREFTSTQSGARLREQGGGSYLWSRLYDLACEHLEKFIQKEQAKIQSDAAVRLESARQRLDTYYRGMAAETLEPLRRLLRRMGSIEAQMGLGTVHDAQRLEHWHAEAGRLSSMYQGELDQLETERKRRMEELAQKHRIRTEIQPTQIAWVHVPRIAWRLRLTGPARREVTILYDVLREKVMEFECDDCGKLRPRLFYLCVCRDLVCGDCGPACRGCGGRLPDWQRGGDEPISAVQPEVLPDKSAIVGSG